MKKLIAALILLILTTGAWLNMECEEQESTCPWAALFGGK